MIKNARPVLKKLSFDYRRLFRVSSSLCATLFNHVSVPAPLTLVCLDPSHNRLTTICRKRVSDGSRLNKGDSRSARTSNVLRGKNNVETALSGNRFLRLGLSFAPPDCYRRVMDSSSQNWLLKHITRIFGWRRVRVVLPVCVLFMILFSFTWEAGYRVLIGRLLFFGFAGLFAFGLFEQWPRRLPAWLARWALQVVAVAITMPFAVWIGYSVTNLGLDPPWWRNQGRLTGFATFTFLGMLLAPWMAVSALLKQIRNDASNQALSFDLERSEYEKQALNARLRLLQAQVEPHFLFNTLANVRELVTTGSPRAASVLDSLIAYLRAAVPRINQPTATMGQELDLVRAYLEVMHMRMPDRLAYVLHADEATHALICPPMTLLTLVENAMRHGIDPSEVGGRIDVRVWIELGRCHADVIDTGIGLKHNATRPNDGLGTGLKNLCERLELAFGGDASLLLAENKPHGARVEISFPAKVNEP
jgi:hypothetical protein